MADVARNYNKAFDRGYVEHKAGCKTWQNPYQARYARNAWRAGWDKAHAERDCTALATAQAEQA